MASYSLVLSRLGPDLTGVCLEYLLPKPRKIAKKFRRVMKELTIGVIEMPFYTSRSISDPADQTRLARCIPLVKRPLPPAGYFFKDMFYHVHNTYHFFMGMRLELPQWFVDKYPYSSF